MADADERAALREVVARFLADEGSTSAAREHLDDPLGFAPATWERMSALGWAGLTVPEQYGGAGSSAVELAIVLEEIGRHLVPTPLPGALLAADAFVVAGTAEQREKVLPRLAAGEARATLAVPGPSGMLDDLGARLRRAGAGARLSGETTFVPDAHCADYLVVAAADGGGAPTLVLVEPAQPGVRVTPTPTVDQTRRFAAVAFDDVEIAPDAIMTEPGAGERALDALVARAALAVAADSLGGARRAMELSVEYATGRVQFGRPIGTFQAVKHACANMLLAVEGARTAVERAAEELASDPLAAGPWPSIAKSYAADAFARVAGSGVQVHGGIGFTWEYDMHLYLKRAKLNQALWGDSAWHRERLARAVLAQPAASPGEGR